MAKGERGRRTQGQGTSWYNKYERQPEPYKEPPPKRTPDMEKYRQKRIDAMLEAREIAKEAA